MTAENKPAAVAGTFANYFGAPQPLTMDSLRQMAERLTRGPIRAEDTSPLPATIILSGPTYRDYVRREAARRAGAIRRAAWRRRILLLLPHRPPITAAELRARLPRNVLLTPLPLP